MNRLSILAVTAALALTGVAAPAFAAGDAGGYANVPFCNSSSANALKAQKEALAAQLHLSNDPGAVITVWNGCLEVISTVDGHSTMTFYDPDSLRVIETL